MREGLPTITGDRRGNCRPGRGTPGIRARVAKGMMHDDIMGGPGTGRERRLDLRRLFGQRPIVPQHRDAGQRRGGRKLG